MPPLLRKGHFLGAKLRSLRKRNALTLEELSARCIQRDAQLAPSVSYLSMIESGKRTPSQETLELVAAVFQRDPEWFLDESADLELSLPQAPKGGAARIPLEPAFLFSKDVLQAAIPELLAQTGTTGRQFAHLLIRSHQEMSRNDFPDLERAADEVGGRRFPLSVDDLVGLCKQHGLEIRWFDRKPVLARDKDREVRSMVRSFFEPPGIIYANRALQSDPARLKFDLAAHIAHKVLHGGDGMKSAHATGGEMGGSPEGGTSAGGMDAQDVLHAWRDFECSFFAGALLAPRAPFRRFLARERYRIEAGTKLELTPAVVMRRVTKVSPYPYWHFFDAYPPGYLRAVYRGNGIPLPWGNLAQVSDPCPNWAVFRMIEGSRVESGSQISVLRDGDRSLLYCCHSMRVRDMAGNPHVLSVGVDLAPALDSNGANSADLIGSLFEDCLARRGEARIPKAATQVLSAVANVLNIAWIEDALSQPARIICPRSTRCPRSDRCEGARPSRAREIADVRDEILGRD
ncbi:MAG: MerR family transcriptional regulator [Gammaproteobacteria bacterium]|nr:MerR family transcriptional regulator [Gammaproteobacteria bacterium]